MVIWPGSFLLFSLAAWMLWYVRTFWFTVCGCLSSKEVAWVVYFNVMHDCNVMQEQETCLWVNPSSTWEISAAHNLGTYLYNQLWKINVLLLSKEQAGSAENGESELTHDMCSPCVMTLSGSDGQSTAKKTLESSALVAPTTEAPSRCCSGAFAPSFG